MTGWKGISFLPCGIPMNVDKYLVILKDFFLRQKNQVIDWLSVQETALTNPNLV